MSSACVTQLGLHSYIRELSSWSHLRNGDNSSSTLRALAWLLWSHCSPSAIRLLVLEPWMSVTRWLHHYHVSELIPQQYYCLYGFVKSFCEVFCLCLTKMKQSAQYFMETLLPEMSDSILNYSSSNSWLKSIWISVCVCVLHMCVVHACVCEGEKGSEHGSMSFPSSSQVIQRCQWLLSDRGTEPHSRPNLGLCSSVGGLSSDKHTCPTQHWLLPDSNAFP